MKISFLKKIIKEEIHSLLESSDIEQRKLRNMINNLVKNKAISQQTGIDLLMQFEHVIDELESNEDERMPH